MQLNHFFPWQPDRINMGNLSLANKDRADLTDMINALVNPFILRRDSGNGFTEPNRLELSEIIYTDFYYYF